MTAPQRTHLNASLTCLLTLSLFCTTQTLLADPPKGEPRRWVASTVTDDDVEIAIERAVAYLWSRQQPDGRWVSPGFDDAAPLGMTALAVYTLRQAGTPAAHRPLQRAVAHLNNTRELRTVHARSLTLLAWNAMDSEHYRREIADDVRFLALRQRPHGGWGADEQISLSAESHLTLMALAQAAGRGAEVRATIWRRAEQSWLNGHLTDGGWGHALTVDPEVEHEARVATGGATAAGVDALFTIYDQLYLNAELGFNGRFKARCGQEIESIHPILSAKSKGLHWLDRHFRVDAVPGVEEEADATSRHAQLTWFHHALARTARQAGRRSFGDKAWFPDVARHLVNAQQPNGAWGSLPETCHGILTLLEGRVPIAINKLKYGPAEDWNLDRRDAGNLTRWLSRRLGSPSAWQVVDIDDTAATSILSEAPLLLITGHEAPEFTPEHEQKLLSFVQRGGTIMAVSCCTREAFFHGAVERFAALFPDLHGGPLDVEHPVWTIEDVIAPAEDVWGLGDECRTSVFFLHNAACCAWQQNLTASHARRFQLAGNILRYATFGRPPPGRLTAMQQRPTFPPMRDIAVARLHHAGDQSADPMSLTRLSKRLSDRTGVGLAQRPAMAWSELSTADVDAVWLTGHAFDPEEAGSPAGLLAYLERGGTLIASACCGREAFHEAVEPWLAEVLSPHEWTPLDAEDPLLTGRFLPGLAGHLGNLTLRPRYQAPLPARMDRPVIRGVRMNGRWAVLYSPYDIHCALSGHSCLDCVGYVTDDAKAVAGNLLLYALSHRAEKTGQ